MRRHEEEAVLSDATYHGQALSQPGKTSVAFDLFIIKYQCKVSLRSLRVRESYMCFTISGDVIGG